MSLPTRPPPGERTDASMRILAAAKALFAHHGYEGVSIRDIAVQANVSKANIFHHFVSKAGLYKAVLEDTSSMFETLLECFRGDDDDGSERIGRFARRNLETMLEDPDAVHLFLRQMLNRRGNSQRADAEAIIARDLARIRHHVGAELPGVGNPAADPLVLTLCILGTNFIYFQLQDVLPRLPQADPPADHERFSQQLMALLHPAISHSG